MLGTRSGSARPDPRPARARVRLRVVAYSALASFLVLQPGCSGGDDAGPPSPFDQYRQRSLLESCELLHRCPSTFELFNWLRRNAQTPEKCAELLGRYEDDRQRALELAMAEGSVVYDAVEAERCFSGFDASCSGGSLVLRGGQIPCSSAFTGTVGLGGDCDVSEQCAGDAFCDWSAWTCPGTCAERVGLGQPCRGGDECSMLDGRTECDWVETRGERVCVSLSVGPDAVVAEACGVTTDDTTTTIVRCAEGSYCDRATELCRARLAAGEPCSDSDSICVDDHFCVDGVCERVSVGAEGDFCDDRGYVCDFVSRLACVGGSCVAVGLGRRGTPCSPDPLSPANCDRGLICHTDWDVTGRSTCELPLAAGEACDANNECASGTCEWILAHDECASGVCEWIDEARVCAERACA